ncbi:MAG: DUF3037 domain-containing protein [Pyrinomonadaceae bacterium]
MPEKCLFDYAVVRLVPRVEREEFINVGVIVSCTARQFLKARLTVDQKRLTAFAPDVEIVQVYEHLKAIEKICEGGKQSGAIGELPARARFYWLTAPRSTIIQTSPVHSGLCDEPETALEKLFKTMIQPIEIESKCGSETKL